MIYRDTDAKRRWVENCHHGSGRLWCIERIADYRRTTPGVKYVHEDVLDPGCSIGEHRHEGDEEVYLIMEGRGTMTVDGREFEVGPGDVCLTRSGHRHSLYNQGPAPLRLVVVCTNTTGAET